MASTSQREASAKGPAKGPGKGPAKGPAKGKGKSPAQVSQVPGRVEIVILKFVSLHHDVSSQHASVQCNI